MTVGQGDGLGLAARVSGKGLAHAHILVIAEILGKIRARVAAGGPAEMAAAAGARGLHGAVVAFGPAAGASAAAKTAGGLDHPTQTTGSASLYGTSAPLPPGAAASPNAAPAKDSGVAHMLSRDPRMNKAAALQPPSPPGTPVVSNPGGATGFNGLTHADQRNAGTGQYVNTQFSLEPPDQGLCVGHGFVLEPVNDAFAVYNESGARLTAFTALNQFYNRSPAINRVTGVTGDFLSDPKCYWDPVGQRFIQTDPRSGRAGQLQRRCPVQPHPRAHRGEPDERPDREVEPVLDGH